MKTFLIIIGSLIVGIIVANMLLVKDTTTVYRDIIRKDTIYQKFYREPILINEAKPEIIYLYDTVYSSRAFIAKFDTILSSDTIYGSYEFPQNLMSIKVNRMPDSIMTEKIYYREYEKQKLWEVAIYILSGTFIGYLLAQL